MSTSTVQNPKIVSREEWLAARKNLLAREKQLTRDAVAAERRQLPWVENRVLADSLRVVGKRKLTDRSEVSLGWASGVRYGGSC
jgi:predicted dithiol-disulfide oxidoreductase (DUF899 family)